MTAAASLAENGAAAAGKKQQNTVAANDIIPGRKVRVLFYNKLNSSPLHGG